ncbi:MAG: hypothetical protein AAB671_00135 [Patescibacteria group bacterium]
MYHNYTNYQNKRWDSPQRKGNFGSGTYTLKKKVKYFTDLEVYQKSQQSAVFCAKELLRALDENTSRMLKEEIADKMILCSLRIPHLIAESHGKRFGTGEESLAILDQVMLNCNRMVAYLEQARDLLGLPIEHDRWEEQIKNYFYIRQKVLNLQRVWRKYINENQQS